MRSVSICGQPVLDFGNLQKAFSSHPWTRMHTDDEKPETPRFFARGYRAIIAGPAASNHPLRWVSDYPLAFLAFSARRKSSTKRSRRAFTSSALFRDQS